MSTSSHSEALVGVWCTDNPGGHTGETLVFFPDGTGAIDYYNVAFCGRQTFKWSVQTDHRLHFDGHINIFRVENAEFEIDDFVDLTEEKRKILTIYPKGRDQRPERFISTGWTVQEYENPEETRTSYMFGFSHADLDAARQTIETALSIQLEKAKADYGEGHYYRAKLPSGPCIRLCRNFAAHQGWTGPSAAPWHSAYGILVWVHGKSPESITPLLNSVPGLKFLEQEDTMS